MFPYGNHSKLSSSRGASGAAEPRRRLLMHIGATGLHLPALDRAGAAVPDMGILQLLQDAAATLCISELGIGAHVRPASRRLAEMWRAHREQPSRPPALGPFGGPHRRWVWTDGAMWPAAAPKIRLNGCGKSFR